MELKYLVGTISLIVIEGATLFQIVKFIKSKETKGVSLGFWLALNVGLALSLVYAILIKDPIYIISGIINSILNGLSLILFLYYKYKKK
jgi:uncharacterized protein with PQ loop repeat